jgi:hypothetical protein
MYQEDSATNVHDNAEENLTWISFFIITMLEESHIPSLLLFIGKRNCSKKNISCDLEHICRVKAKWAEKAGEQLMLRECGRKLRYMSVIFFNGNQIYSKITKYYWSEALYKDDIWEDTKNVLTKPKLVERWCPIDIQKMSALFTYARQEPFFPLNPLQY